MRTSKTFFPEKFVDTIKVEKKNKYGSASALGLGSSGWGKELAAKAPVPGESLHQGHASQALWIFGIIFRMRVEAKWKSSFSCEWSYQALVLLGVCFHGFWAEGSFPLLIELRGGKSEFKVRLFSCSIRSSSAISAVFSEEPSHHHLGGLHLSSAAL